MITREQLEKMKYRSIEEIDRSELVDIQNIKIDTQLPSDIRMLQYLEQIKNPYCFLCGDTPVRISFQEEGKELDDLLKHYFIR